ncbi:hypothetical protein Leryth_006327 [Lithospermum erythrorhizon]|nr:hypothetical protein Leryth_006327 [Lithospermum erythrorhizon]
MTNEVCRISWLIKNEDEESSRNVLVRLYGDGVELFFDRLERPRRLSACLGPTLSADDLRDTEISALIASKVRELHELDMPGPMNVVLWDRLRTWLSIAKRICSVEHMKEFRLDELGYEIKGLEHKFSFEQKIGFCHNDLQYGLEECHRFVRAYLSYSGHEPNESEIEKILEEAEKYTLASHICWGLWGSSRHM